jgi:hypothetical protein
MMVGHGTRTSSALTAGLDQLGPKHWQGDGHVLTRHSRRDSLKVRSQKSSGARNVKVTLPKFNLPPEPEE